MRMRFGNQPLVETLNSTGTGSDTAYRLSSRFADILATNRTFRIFFADTLRTGMANCRDMFREAAARQQVFDHMFLYERKYSMADVMRLCGWKKENTPQNVGGYLLDKETNTMPIFVKYAASQYEDEFLSTQEMKYFSKNGRTPQSPEFDGRLAALARIGTTHISSRYSSCARRKRPMASTTTLATSLRLRISPTLTKPDATGQGSVGPDPRPVDLNFARVSFMVRCFGPRGVGGDEGQVHFVLRRRRQLFLAFSASSRRR